MHLSLYTLNLSTWFLHYWKEENFLSIDSTSNFLKFFLAHENANIWCSKLFDVPQYLLTSSFKLWCMSDVWQMSFILVWCDPINFSQFEIEFSASTRCLCVCLRCLRGTHAILLDCANMCAITSPSNTNNKTKYNCFALGSLNDTLCIMHM